MTLINALRYIVFASTLVETQNEARIDSDPIFAFPCVAFLRLVVKNPLTFLVINLCVSRINAMQGLASLCEPTFMLGDPAQLPAVGRSKLFGTQLWRTFSVLVLREIKRSQDPVLTSIFTKVRMGVCDKEVTDVLRGLVHPRDVDNIELDRTVVICSTRNECDEVNNLCINRIDGSESVYEALDTDHHGHPLREADELTVLKYRETS